jgi:PAS domain S-box-containing protein
VIDVPVLIAGVAAGALLAFGATALRGRRRQPADAERALRASEERFGRIFHANPLSTVLSRLDDGRFIDANEAFLQLLGYTRAEVIGRTAVELGVWFDPAERDRVLVALERNKGSLRDVPTVARRKDGTGLECLLDCTVVELEGGRYLISILRDETPRNAAARELRRMNEELERRVAERTRELAQANSELESFGYSIAHDLRAPLRAISGYARILADEHARELPGEARDAIDQVLRASAKMTDMIDGLLRLARLARIELRHERVDLSAIANEELERLRAEHPGRPVAATVASGLSATGDPALLESLMRNLLSNAWKFSAGVAEARIEFGARADADGRLVYYVRDNGAGFDMHYAGTLFSPFRRMHAEREFPGTGIGLSTVQRIVRRHGGRVWAEAEVGRGATFYFTLPV